MLKDIVHWYALQLKITENYYKSWRSWFVTDKLRKSARLAAVAHVSNNILARIKLTLKDEPSNPVVTTIAPQQQQSTGWLAAMFGSARHRKSFQATADQAAAAAAAGPDGKVETCRMLKEAYERMLHPQDCTKAIVKVSAICPSQRISEMIGSICLHTVMLHLFSFL